MKAHIHLDVGRKTFASGLLPELIAALRRSRPGDLVAITSAENAEGVYWHPVGAEDADLLVTGDIFPLAESFAAVQRAFDREGEHANKLARIFNCA